MRLWEVEMSDILTRMGFTIGAGIILSGDHQERSVANRQFIQAKDELTTLRQQLAEMQALAYYYPPTAPFALDGVTWKQRAEEAERKLENPDIEKVARVFHDAYEDAALRHV